MPDTPHFFIMKGNREAAVKSLKFYRDVSADDVAEEMDEIELTVVESMKLKAGFTEIFKGRANLIGNSCAKIFCTIFHYFSFVLSFNNRRWSHFLPKHFRN